ncbi:MAG TPA: hypothetical protein VHV55_28355 [Pirellulales bacterium]|jgi:hypothetical protein|nr:hypothetical protein [Pirellulales bacterium]
MNELDKMFEAPSEMALPPLVRYCKSRKEAGDRIEVELYRPDAGGSSQTGLVIHRWENEMEQTPYQVEWDDGVNAGLVDLGIRAINLQQEGERFAFSIRAALRHVERRYGDGYLSAVLVDLLDESDLCKGGEIFEVRKFVHAGRPERNRSYHACRDLIADEIGGRAVELRDKLAYRPDEVKTVMTKALAIYLDERFSVSSRRNFGLL